MKPHVIALILGGASCVVLAAGTTVAARSRLPDPARFVLGGIATTFWLAAAILLYAAALGELR